MRADTGGGQPGRGHTRRLWGLLLRFVVRFVIALPILAILLPSLLVLALSAGMNPPTSAFMATDWIHGKATGDNGILPASAWVDIDNVSLNMRAAVIAHEDSQFLGSFWGVDVNSFRDRANKYYATGERQER